MLPVDHRRQQHKIHAANGPRRRGRHPRRLDRRRYRPARRSRATRDEIGKAARWCGTARWASSRTSRTARARGPSPRRWRLEGRDHGGRRRDGGGGRGVRPDAKMTRRLDRRRSVLEYVRARRSRRAGGDRRQVIRTECPHPRRQPAADWDVRRSRWSRTRRLPLRRRESSRRVHPGRWGRSAGCRTQSPSRRSRAWGRTRSRVATRPALS